MGDEIKTLDQLSEELVVKAVESRTNAITAVKEELQANIDKKIDEDKVWKNGFFDTTNALANGSYARIFNEADGGGTQYFNSISKVKSYVGVHENNGKQDGDITVQIYSIDDEDKLGTRINVNQLGAYYLAGTTNIGTPAGRELAVKDDVASVSQDVSNLLSKVENEFSTIQYVDDTFATKADTYTKAEVDELVAAAVNEAIAGVLKKITEEFGE